MDEYWNIIKKHQTENENREELENELWQLVDDLQHELKIKDENLIALKNSFQQLSNCESLEITSKYCSLKGSYANLEQKNHGLENEIKELKEYFHKHKQQIEREFIQKLEEKDKEIKVLSLQNDTKEKELFSELQMVQSAHVMEISEVEEKLRKQLHEANRKLRENIETVSVLRTELLHIKEEYSNYVSESKEKILRLQKKLEEQTESLMNSADELSDHSDSHPHSESARYLCKKPLIRNKKTPIVHRGSFKRWNEHLGAKKQNPTLPAPIDVSQRKEKPILKKRRLFNPDDLSYLEENDLK